MALFNFVIPELQVGIKIQGFCGSKYDVMSNILVDLLLLSVHVLINHIMLQIVAWPFLSACAGQYTCKDGKNRSCLVYVGFNHKIYVYYKVELERMESTNLLKVLEEKPEFRSHVKELGVGRYTENSFKCHSGQTGASWICCRNWTRGKPWLFVVNLSVVKLGLWPEC